MTEKIKDYLEHDEKVLWSGKPEAFDSADKTHKTYYARRSIWVAVVAIAVIAAYLYAAITTEAGIKAGVIVVLVAVSIYAFVSPALDIRKLRKCEYVLTNEKLILVTSSDVRSVKLSSIPTAKVFTDQDGHCSLLCGPDADALPAHKLRVSTLTGAITNQDTGMCDRFVFYAVDDMAGLKKAAEGYLTIA